MGIVLRASDGATAIADTAPERQNVPIGRAEKPGFFRETDSTTARRIRVSEPRDGPCDREISERLASWKAG
jgi:hypothetical protein